MKLKWTRKKPNKERHYYVRKYKGEAAKVMVIHKNIVGELYGRCINRLESFPLSRWDGCQFAGPLPDQPKP